MVLNDTEIRKTYMQILKLHDLHLKKYGVTMPKLMKDKDYTKNALVLVYLFRGYPNTNVVSKNELTEFVRQYYPKTTDVQQARHLAAQSGWYILSGTRGDIEIDEHKLKEGEYKLVSMEEPYPGFTKERRVEIGEDNYFEAIKKKYNYRCACCGSKEGESHLLWPRTRTVLQKGHMDPNKPLNADNIIPQCDKCNRPDRNFWIYDAKGRVVSIANAKVVKRCSLEVRREMYELLKKEFDKQNKK